jgi:hypothetical protein
VGREFTYRLLQAITGLADVPLNAALEKLIDANLLRSPMPVYISIAQRTASTTLRNSIMIPSPVRLTTRPW